MKQWKKLVSICLMAGALGACGTASKQAEQDDAARQAELEEQRRAAQEQTGFQGSPLDDPASPLSKRTIYFDFDSYEVKAADRELIQAHARYLAQNPNEKIVLEGHTDERGTREYNIALGERRAKAVTQLMLLQGVSQSQLDMISFGEERPVALGHDESAWSLNRRVEILYSGH